MDLYGFAITFKEFPGYKNKYSMEYSNIIYFFYIRIKKFTHIRLRENVAIVKSSKFDLVISYMSMPSSLKQRNLFSGP